MYSINRKSYTWQGLVENLFLASSSFWWLQHAWASLGGLAASPQSLPLFSYCLLPVCASPLLRFLISICLSVGRTFVTGFRAHADNSGWRIHFKIFHICKDPFSIRITITGFGDLIYIFFGEIFCPATHSYGIQWLLLNYLIKLTNWN